MSKKTQRDTEYHVLLLISSQASEQPTVDYTATDLPPFSLIFLSDAIFIALIGFTTITPTSYIYITFTSPSQTSKE